MLSYDEIKEAVVEKFLNGEITLVYSQYNRYYKILSVSKSGKSVKVHSKASYLRFGALEELPNDFFKDTRITNRNISWVYDRVGKSSFMQNWKDNGDKLFKNDALDDILNLI